MAEAEKKADPRTVQLKRVRLSFSDSLGEARPTVENGVPKHSCNFILEKDKPEFEANKEKVRGAMEAAGIEFNGKKDLYIRVMEDDPKRVCYRAGSRFKNKDGDIYRGYEGNMAISASGPGGNKNPRRPKLYDRRKKAVEVKDIDEVMYGGSYADVILSFFATDKGGLGVFASIEAIRSHEEGERMGGGTYVDQDDFEDMEDADDAFSGTDSAVDPLG